MARWGMIDIMTQGVLDEGVGRLFRFIFKNFNLNHVDRTPPKVRSVLRPFGFFFLCNWRSVFQWFFGLLFYLDLNVFFILGLAVKSRVFRRSGHAHHCDGVGSQNCVMRPQTTQCAGLPNFGVGTPMPRMDLDSPCVPVGWRVALFGGLGDEM